MACPSPPSSPCQSYNKEKVHVVNEGKSNSGQGLLGMTTTQLSPVRLERGADDDYGWGLEAEM